MSFSIIASGKAGPAILLWFGTGRHRGLRPFGVSLSGKNFAMLPKEHQPFKYNVAALFGRIKFDYCGKIRLEDKKLAQNKVPRQI
jgi:hypothetical protein